MLPWDLFLTFSTLLGLYGRPVVGILLNILHDDPDVYKNVSGLITSKGYPLEEHTVQTADGYLLSVQRIPYGRESNFRTSQNGVVLLIHGVQGDAGNWVLNFPGQSLGFVLPDAGYDTWLLNTRGCTYSRRHVKYSTHQYQFWNFSFAEVGKFDVPATIDYILEATGKDCLYIIAHSQGTTGTFVMLSELSDYNDKVKLFIALAPIITVGYTTSLARLAVLIPDAVYHAMGLITSGEFTPNSKIFRFLRAKTCEFATELCEDLLFLVGGVDRQPLNETRMGVYAANFPASTSIKSLLHYKQIVISKKFRKYDYGRKNIEHYHQEDPPEYDVPSITTPVALFWSTNDLLADPEDVSILRGKLNSLVVDYRIPYPYNHFDFVLALNSFKWINEPILELLPQF